ncbi:MAG: sugar transferase [Marinifilaceae bacterium]
MIKGREAAIARISIWLQVLLTLGCYLLVRFGMSVLSIHSEFKNDKVIFILIAAIWYFLLYEFNLGKMLRVKTYSALLVEYLAMITIGGVILIIGFYLLEEEAFGLFLLLFALVNLVVLYGFRMITFRIFKFIRGKGYNTRSVLIIADNETYYHFIDRLISTKDWGYQIWAIMTDSPQLRERFGQEITILPNHSDLSEIIDANIIDEVIYCKGNFGNDEVRNLVYACNEVGVVLRIHSELLNVVSMRSHITYFKELPFLTFANITKDYFALKVKYFIDFVVSLLILIFISPIMLVIAAAIKLGDGGPVFFKQKRVGLNGRHFFCLKFRTMVQNAEALKEKLKDQNEQEGPVFKIKNDPRVTRIGRFLRKTSMDELPQFLNVLKGEMSIVGPRPPVPSEVKQYERWQRRRLSMRPGITCIWQVSGRNNIPFDQWMKLDMLYIDTWSLKLDLILFLSTIKVFITGDGQ